MRSLSPKTANVLRIRVARRAKLDELIQIYSSDNVSPYHLALISLGLGDSDKTIEFLNKAMDERAERLV